MNHSLFHTQKRRLRYEKGAARALVPPHNGGVSSRSHSRARNCVSWHNNHPFSLGSWTGVSRWQIRIPGAHAK